MQTLGQTVAILCVILGVFSLSQSSIAEDRCSTTSINVTGVLDLNATIDSAGSSISSDAKLFNVDWTLSDYFKPTVLLNLRFKRVSVASWVVYLAGQTLIGDEKTAKKYIGEMKIRFDSNGNQGNIAGIGFGAELLDNSLPEGNRIVVDLNGFQLQPGKRTTDIKVQSEQSSSCSGFGEIADPIEVNGSANRISSPTYYNLEDGQKAMLNDVKTE